MIESWVEQLKIESLSPIASMGRHFINYKFYIFSSSLYTFVGGGCVVTGFGAAVVVAGSTVAHDGLPTSPMISPTKQDEIKVKCAKCLII